MFYSRISRIKVAGVILAGLSLVPASAQLKVSGQASTAFVRSGRGPSQYVYNEGRETFDWRLDIFADALLSENITLLSNFRMLQDEIPHIDLIALRISDVASTGITAEVGEIDIPFGNLGQRRFPKTNPFLGLPLIREHRTTLRSSDYELWLADSRYTSAGNGVRILDQGLYDLGIKAGASAGAFDFYAAITNGMLSAASGYYQGGLNAHHGFGKTFRIAMTPVIGLTVGASYAFGPFMSDAAYYGYPATTYRDPAEHLQQIIGGDVDFSYEHFTFYGELAHNVWNLADSYGSDLSVTGYSLEGSYTFAPRFSVAARVGVLRFSTITTTLVQRDSLPALYTGGWDNDHVRLEGALGYRFTREVAFKIVYELNEEVSLASDPADNVFAVQVVATF
ncbi:MAG TPA: hypothetical protein VGR15_07370 [Bacteroidota bacterium]|jgi:hypothetical protein|nr:hypothetical protein [Bacteroidota bacterium]